MASLLVAGLLVFSVASFPTDLLFEETEKCDLPTYIAILPLEYRRELRKIWANGPRTKEYCARQRRRTDKLIAELPAEIREKIKGFTVTTTESPAETSFLNGLSSEHVHEFNAIMSDRSLGALDRSERLREWAVDLLDLEAMDRLERYVQFLERRGDKFKEKVGPDGPGPVPGGVKHGESHNRVWFQLRRLSPSAVSVYNRLEILKLERKSLLSGLPEKVKNELIELWRLKCSQTDSGLQDDEKKLACKKEEVVGAVIEEKLEKSEKTTTTSTTPSTTTSTTTQATSTNSVRKWRPFPNGIPQLGTDDLSRLLQRLFSPRE